MVKHSTLSLTALVCILYTGLFAQSKKIDTTLWAPGTRAMPSPLSSAPFPSGDWVGTYKIGANNDPAD